MQVVNRSDVSWLSKILIYMLDASGWKPTLAGIMKLDEVSNLSATWRQTCINSLVCLVVYHLFHGRVLFQNIWLAQACFIRRISVASNTIQTTDNEVHHLIIYCWNCSWGDWNATYKTGLIFDITPNYF